MNAGRKNNISKKDYNTPPKYVSLIEKFFNGQIELDPCSNSFSLINAQHKIQLPQDGLLVNWEDYNNIFVNCPYGRDSERKTSIRDWVLKGFNAHRQNISAEILYLIPVATNTFHFKEIIFKSFTGICFLKDTRLKFYNQGKEDKKGAPMSCCMVYLGNDYGRFESIFKDAGKCFPI